MTLNDETTVYSYSGNDSATQWTYAFSLSDTDDVQVTVVKDSTGESSVIASSLYTVNDTLKKVTYPLTGDPLATGYTIVIERDTPETQPINYTVDGAFDTEAVEDAYDRITMMIQELNARIERCVEWNVWDEMTTRDAKDFLDAVSGIAAWGTITGTLSDQTDLKSALDGKQAANGELSAIAGLSSAADKLPYFTGEHTASLATFTSTARDLLDDTSVSAMRTTLGVDAIASKKSKLDATTAPTTGDDTVDGYAVGSVWIDISGDKAYICADSTESAAVWKAVSDYQPLNTNLSALAGLTSAADKGIQFTGTGTAATFDLTTAGKALLDDANATAQRSTLGLSNVVNTLHQPAATTAPTVGDDTADGYTVSSIWIDTTNDKSYICVDNSAGAAVWQAISSANLNALSGLTSAADKGIQYTGTGTAATYDLTTAGKALLDDANAAAQRVTLGLSTYEFGITIGDGSTAPATGSKGIRRVPVTCTITNWYIDSDASGSCVVDLKRSGTSIVGGSGNKPTLSSASSANAAASSWTSTAITANDAIEFNLDSVTTCTRINLVIVCTI